MKTLESAFQLLLQASLSATALIALVLLIRRSIHRRAYSRMMPLVWLLVLIKLLIPIVPATPFNLYMLVPPMTHDAPKVQPAPSAHASDKPAISPSQTSPADAIQESGAAAPVSEAAPDRPHRAAKEALASGSLWLIAGSLVWLAGGLALVLIGALAALRYRRRMKASLPVADPAVRDLLQACLARLGIRRAIAVYENDAVASPCLYGLIKPAIYLPTGLAAESDTRQLEHILLHELTHFKRKDHWLNAVWMLAAAVYWFNPFVWLAMRSMKADREVACDAGVLDTIGERESAAYGMTLIRLSRRLAGQPTPGVPFSFLRKNGGEIKRRITMIARFRKGSYRLSLAAVILILGLGALLFTAATPPFLSHKTMAKSQDDGRGSLGIVRLMDRYKWFHNLARARAFVSFAFKVPDDIPAGYELENVEVLQRTPEQQAESVTLAFQSGYGTDDVKRFKIRASTADLRDEYRQQPGAEMRTLAPATWGAAAPIDYSQEPAEFAGIQGTLATQIQTYDWHLPERAKSFIWQDGDIWYALDYWSENHTREEGLPQHWLNLTDAQRDRLLRSFVPPGQLRQADYSGAGNSFPLYDEEDLAAAEQILGFDAKLPRGLLDDRLQLSDAMLLRPQDHNTGFYFRPPGDALERTYRAPYDAPIGDLNDYVTLYQSRTPLIDNTKLPPTDHLDAGGVDVAIFKDLKRSFDPYGIGTGQTDDRSHTYYVWSESGLHYMAFFRGLDNLQSSLIQELVAAEGQ